MWSHFLLWLSVVAGTARRRGQPGNRFSKARRTRFGRGPRRGSDKGQTGQVLWARLRQQQIGHFIFSFTGRSRQLVGKILQLANSREGVVCHVSFAQGPLYLCLHQDPVVDLWSRTSKT
ncbi:hypothetical protein H4582DRAFT_737551 [Lactarius indigo]|nr:hypothetical protein H4582DRAFT_737551 [Lactarius indigo]